MHQVILTCIRIICLSVPEQGVPASPEGRKEEISLEKDIAAVQLATAARVARLTEEVIKVAAVIEVKPYLELRHRT